MGQKKHQKVDGLFRFNCLWCAHFRKANVYHIDNFSIFDFSLINCNPNKFSKRKIQWFPQFFYLYGELFLYLLTCSIFWSYFIAQLLQPQEAHIWVFTPFQLIALYIPMEDLWFNVTNVAHAVKSMLKISSVASDFIRRTVIADRSKASLTYVFASGNAKWWCTRLTMSFEPSFVWKVKGR